MKIWLNGKIVDDKDAKVSIFDRGFLYGDGVFETMRSYNGRVFKLGEHLDRLCNSLKDIGVKIPHSKSFLERQIYTLLRINRLFDAYVRITVTRGAGTVGLAETACKTPTVVIIVKKFEPYPARLYKNGIAVKLVKIRQNENSPISMIKSTSFLNYILARLEAKRAGFDDAIMLNSKGEVCESTVSNIFLIRKRELLTPALASGILAGITRAIILELAPRVGLKAKAKAKAITVKWLYSADEVFLTNSLMEVMPVVRVDNRVIGRRQPGVLTRRLHSAYREIIRENRD